MKRSTWYAIIMISALISFIVSDDKLTCIALFLAGIATGTYFADEY